MGFKMSDFRPETRRRIRASLPATSPDVERGPTTFALPWPPSLNRLWANKRGRRVCTPEYQVYKDAAAKAALSLGLRPYGGKVDVTMWLHLPRGITTDSDNRSKAVLDAMNQIAWHDDAQVNQLHVIPVPDSDKPRIVLTLTPVAMGVKG